MTTKGFFFIPLRVSFPTRMSLSMRTVDLCLRKEPGDGQHVVVRRCGSILATPHQPKALRVTESNASPPCPSSPPPSPYAPPRRQRLPILAVGTAIIAGKGVELMTLVN